MTDRCELQAEVERLRGEVSRLEGIRVEQAAKLKRHIDEAADLREEAEGLHVKLHDADAGQRMIERDRDAWKRKAEEAGRDLAEVLDWFRHPAFKGHEDTIDPMGGTYSVTLTWREVVLVPSKIRDAMWGPRVSPPIRTIGDVIREKDEGEKAPRIMYAMKCVQCGWITRSDTVMRVRLTEDGAWEQIWDAPKPPPAVRVYHLSPGECVSREDGNVRCPCVGNYRCGKHTPPQRLCPTHFDDKGRAW